MQPSVKRYTQTEADSIAARTRIVSAMYERFVRATGCQRSKTKDAVAKATIMRNRLRGDPDRFPGFRPETPLELAFVGCDGDYEPTREPEPTLCECGGPAKLKVLAARVAAGEETFHKLDNVDRW